MKPWLLWLLPLRWRSDVPGGLVAMAVGLLALFALGVLVGVRSTRRHRRWVAWGLAAVSGGWLSLGVLAEVLPQEDLSPHLAPESLVGTWRQGAERLVLRADHSFALEGSVTDQGTWRLSEGTVSLGTRSARVVTVRGEPCLVLDFPADAGAWQGGSAFFRE
jgi:hypothetical protein